MRTLPLLTLPLLLLAAPAHADVAGTYARWKYLRDAGGVAAFEESYGFIRQHPGWPQENVIRMRAEQAALTARPDSATMHRFCTDYPPISGRGMIACARAGAGSEAERATWVKQGWKQGDFSGHEEDSILSQYSFTAAEHEARIDRLLFEGKVSAAQRLMPRLSPAQRLLAEARIALISNARNVTAKVHGVPSALKDHPGLIFNRMQWRARHGEEAGVRELLMAGPSDPPYADLWWPQRARAVREAVEDGRHSQAMVMLRKAGKLNAENNADAHFLRGWLLTEFLGDAREGYKEFYALFDAVSTPVSKSRAAYWAGRAARKNGNPDIARDWFRKGAEFPTVFYGQLSASELDKAASLDLPSNPSPSSVADETMAKTAMWLVGQGETDMANLFLNALTDRSSAGEASALAKRAVGNQYVHGGVKVAKQAIRRNIILTEAGWPMYSVPKQSPIEPALALAIARQESEFNPKARSRADARGLMQVLPGTANLTARRNGLPYDARHLYEPQPNMVIGTTYLGGLIDGWDGSYILAIASYNAGPANARKWVGRFGAPPRDVAGAINWIEMIPFAETRNYVQRVLENVQVYRSRMDEDAPLGIARDLTR